MELETSEWLEIIVFVVVSVVLVVRVESNGRQNRESIKKLEDRSDSMQTEMTRQHKELQEESKERFSKVHSKLDDLADRAGYIEGDIRESNARYDGLEPRVKWNENQIDRLRLEN